MRTVLIAAALGLFAASSAAAQSPLVLPKVTTQCIEVGGRDVPAVCQMPGSRIDGREHICTCPQGQRVDVPVCAKGERPQAVSAAFERFRNDAVKDGSLIGDKFEGRQVCVRPHGD